MKKKDSKNKAKIELLILMIFMVFAFTYTKMLSLKNKPNIDNIPSNSINSPSNEDISFKDIVNYNFKIKATINKNEGTKVLNYTGNVNNTNGSIIKDGKSYHIINNEYYDNEYNKANDLFDVIEAKYFSLDNISNYITRDNLKNNHYETKVNVIVNNQLQEAYIYLDIINNTTIKIDYTNLAKLTDTTINSYLVEYTIDRI